ncbi:hypothetical protein ACOMICROBIO_GDFFDHBD_01897 [Vibrio sp. B1REV9]|uniref:hypothetical protein n=1 Tax=Vibrio TaxID=662 RepID=UPI001AF7138E|nr:MULTISPECIES: hypothetical protein [Vibrio]BBM67063.1 hypothetical protein VA249_37090 [Vibrio alfacsensis]CAE6919568.1 hypothetical protein ACOMICROBIO_GDFFDHBD_01897 [Vibrio sp. B1REV9]
MKWMSIVSLLSLSAIVVGCGGDSSDSGVSVRALNFQTVNLVDQGSSGVSDISVNAKYKEKQEVLYSNLPLYGSSESGVMLIQEKANSFDVTFDLIETNSQQVLSTKTKTITPSNPQIIFALGDARRDIYQLVFQDKPDTINPISQQVSVFVMDARQLTGGSNIDVWVDGSQRSFNLSKRTLSDQIILNVNSSDIPVELIETGTDTVVASCNISTQERAIMVVFDSRGDCRILSVLSPTF